MNAQLIVRLIGPDWPSQCESPMMMWWTVPAPGNEVS